MEVIIVDFCPKLRTVPSILSILLQSGHPSSSAEIIKPKQTELLRKLMRWDWDGSSWKGKGYSKLKCHGWMNLNEKVRTFYSIIHAHMNWRACPQVQLKSRMLISPSDFWWHFRHDSRVYNITDHCLSWNDVKLYHALKFLHEDNECFTHTWE